MTGTDVLQQLEQVRAVADRYLPAFLAGRRAAPELYGTGVTSWQNIGEVETPLDRPPSMARARARLPDLRQEDVRVAVHEGGFVLQAVTVGEGVRVPFCLAVTVVDGRITRFEQYADSAAARPLLDAVRAAEA
jgi:ketosteroid isomerase-like protein